MALDVPTLAPCPLCEYLNRPGRPTFVVLGDRVSVLMNPKQYERGAILVIANDHVTTVLEAAPEVVTDAHRVAQLMGSALVNALGATGLNVFQNNGAPAGQTVPHYHVHVVPRYASSDPARRFREADFEFSPESELEVLANQLKQAVDLAGLQHLRRT